MKIKRSVFCSFCIIEILGIIILLWAWRIGISVILIGIMYMAIYASKKNQRKTETKNCPKCQSAIPLKARICPECGYSYAGGIREDELLEILEQEQEEKMTSDDIDCNFEKIEEIVVDEVASYDGDIEEFLQEREKKSNILEVE